MKCIRNNWKLGSLRINRTIALKLNLLLECRSIKRWAFTHPKLNRPSIRHLKQLLIILHKPKKNLFKKKQEPCHWSMQPSVNALREQTMCSHRKRLWSICDTECCPEYKRKEGTLGNPDILHDQFCKMEFIVLEDHLTETSRLALFATFNYMLKPCSTLFPTDTFRNLVLSIISLQTAEPITHVTDAAQWERCRNFISRLYRSKYV